MYMNCVFDANLKDNKWLYILKGPFLKRLKNNCKFNENRHFTQFAMDLRMAWIWNIHPAIKVEVMDL